MQKDTIRDGLRISWDVPIEMDDGVVLRADVFRPLHDEPCPVLLSHGPYGKGLAFQDAYYGPIWESMSRSYPDTAARSANRFQVWELPDPEFWVANDYICVRVDGRGSGRSPGELDLLSPRESRDYHDCVEWAGTQPWSTGKIGLSGISYYAMNQWRVASLQPPHLAAMFAFEGAADFYRDSGRHGGIATGFWEFLNARQIVPIQHGQGVRGLRSRFTGELVSGPETLTPEELGGLYHDTHELILGEELDTQTYRERSAQWDKVEVPFLSSGSWGGAGLHLRGNVEAFTQAASMHKYLELHGLEHWTHYYSDYGVDLQKRFFDRYLKDIDNGFDREGRVRLNVRHPGDRFVQRSEAEWPLARTKWTRAFLHPDGLALAAEAPAQAQSVSYAALSDGLTFLSDPYPQETEITGPVAARLWIASTTTDADLFVILRLFAPDMKEASFIGSQDRLVPVAMGWLRASHRKLDEERSTEARPYHSHDEPWPLVPGEPVACDVEIWPTSIVVPAGWRIGLSVRGRDYVAPATGIPGIAGLPPPSGIGGMSHRVPSDRPMDVFGGTVTVLSGPDHPSYILLPIIPAKEAS